MEHLLKTVQSIRDKHDAINRSNGASFNIFNITNISTDEVRICRIIKELIDPTGSHYQGDIYLRLFIKHVLHMEQEIAERDYASAIVHRELLIKQDRRIDLFIEIGDKKIPIEVKIYAGDQDQQCQDYYSYALNSKIFYLTLDGHMPSKESIGTLKRECICSISFQNEIITWLNACLNTSETIRIGSIREIIIQVIDILKMLTGKREEGLEMELQKLIMTSKENMKNADLLRKAAEQVEYEMLSKVLLALDHRIEKRYGLKRLINAMDFQQSKTAHSGINYFLHKLDMPGYELWLRVENDASGLYAGLIITENSERTPATVTATKNLRTVITDGTLNSTSWWLTWRYLFDTDGKRPDFKSHNETYYDLADDTYFESFVDSAMNDVHKVLQTLLPPYRDALADVLDASTK